MKLDAHIIDMTMSLGIFHCSLRILREHGFRMGCFHIDIFAPARTAILKPLARERAAYTRGKIEPQREGAWPISALGDNLIPPHLVSEFSFAICFNSLKTDPDLRTRALPNEQGLSCKHHQ